MSVHILSAFTALFLLTSRCSAQQPPTQPPTPAAGDHSQEYLEAHNRARSEVGVVPLRWSPALAKSASLTARLQRDRRNCTFADLTHSRYGGNQLWSSGAEVSPAAAVGVWVAEKRYYNYANSTCEPGRRCGTYTQVVWRASAEVGCAQAACAKERSSLTICFYDPPGNVVGEKPY
ncbi:CAP (Cysteine-rich secretory proteins [Striga asiatica]|uniref:CAP (Cysteine-rich secretory proteins) n=1 Tax=Striga asiatica TaxID=4170 RepID=A0A5A7PE60_STRAF|nr:CAP (Cysteine-rich secretory proteins [Striga asiatica]